MKNMDCTASVESMELLGSRGPMESLEFNIAAARAVDREFNYNFGANLGLLGSGSLGRFSAQTEPRRPVS